MARRQMTYRVVSLHDSKARDARLGATVAERLEMVRELSLMAWAASGRPFPSYTRSEMPIRLAKLADQGGPTDR